MARIKSKKVFRKELETIALEMFEQGAGKPEVFKVLRDKGGNIYEVDEICRETERRVIQGYRKKVEALLLEGKDTYGILELLADDVSKMPHDLFLQLIQTSKEKIIRNSYNTVKQLHQQGASPEEIKTRCVNAVVTEEDVEKHIAHIMAPETQPEGDPSMGGVALGCLFFIGGITLSVASYSGAEGGGAYMIFTGAIIYGAVKIVASLQGSNKRV